MKGRKEDEGKVGVISRKERVIIKAGRKEGAI